MGEDFRQQQNSYGFCIYGDPLYTSSLNNRLDSLINLSLRGIHMEIVKSIDEILDNLIVFENYRNSTKYHNDYVQLVKRGTCFIIWKKGNEVFLGPSRFIGYRNNTIEKHLNYEKKDGRITNPAISEILNSSPEVDERFEQIYVNYCRELGFEPNATGAFGVERKYWYRESESDLSGKDIQNDESLVTLAEEVTNHLGLIEGAMKTISINVYERNIAARKKCIEHYGLNCVVCKFNFFDIYGSIGENFIHVHHLIPLNEIQKEYEVDPIEDLRPVCPNCHSMLHRRKPAYTIEELKAFLNWRVPQN